MRTARDDVAPAINFSLRYSQKRPRTSLLAAKIPSQPLQATMLFEGTCNTAVFNAWVQHFLVPLLSSDHVVVMDNAIFHKSQKTRELIEATGATLLFLPPYSPDLNPIEKSFEQYQTVFLNDIGTNR